MEKIDWQEITEELGEDRWRDDWINLPRQSRLLLSKLVQENRFLSRDAQQIYCGPDSQEELYNAAKIAHSALKHPKGINPPFSVNKSFGSPGLDLSGHNRALITGELFPIPSYYFLGIGFDIATTFPECVAFSVIVSAVVSETWNIYAGKWGINGFAANVPFNNSVLLHYPEYEGTLDGYGVRVGITRSRVDIENWDIQSNASPTDFYKTSIVAIRSAVSGAVGSLSIIAPTWYDIHGNSISI